MRYKLQYTQFSSYSVLIEWPASIEENILHDILSFKYCIENDKIKFKVEVVQTYSSLLVVYDSIIDNVNDRFLELKLLYDNKNRIKKIECLTWSIPVCYDDEFGIDLENFSKEKKCSKDEIIKLHSERIYTVYFIGFLPGFLYLGGLDKRLFLDRKIAPNLNVKKGSVAIGGQQTGVYPQDSPGGWHIIGNSPIELFNANQDPPCLIKAGDKVKFRSIKKQEYLDIRKAVKTFNYQLKFINSNA